MPGPNLKFLNNTSQRLATNRALPTRQLEAIIRYGTAAQRAKAIEKIIPQAFSLSINNATHHVVLTVLEKCDNLVRTELLFSLRKKIADMSRMKVANQVLRAILTNVPPMQQREIAEAFTINTDEEELLDVCRHEVGNHLIQKLLELPAAAAVLKPKLEPHILSLVSHPVGQHVVAVLINSVEDGAIMVAEALCPGGDGDDEVLGMIVDTMEETAVLCALLKSDLVSVGVKEAIERVVLEKLGTLLSLEKKSDAEADDADDELEPSFGPATKVQNQRNVKEASGRHNFLISACLENPTSNEQRAALWKAIVESGLLAQLCATKGQNGIVCSMVRVSTSASQRAALVKAVLGTDSTIKDAACHPRRTIVVRALIETHIGEIASHVKCLVENVKEIAEHPVGSPVVQRVAEFGDDAIKKRLVAAFTASDISTLCVHPVATYFFQQLLEACDEGDREKICNAVLAATTNLREALSTAAGSRVLQKAVSYGSDNIVTKVSRRLEKAADMESEGKDYRDMTEEEKKEADNKIKRLNKSERRDAFGPVQGDDALLAFSLHPHACFVVESILKETKRRGLEPQRKRLMNALKPHVFDLAVSPWAGRIVLEQMMVTGSKELQSAIKDVVFLKAEAWLSVAPIKEGAGLDPTTKKALRGDRSNELGKKRDRSDDSKAPASDVTAEPVAKKKSNAINKKKILRSFKK